MGVLVHSFVEAAHLLHRAEAPSQGIFSGDNPAEYNRKDPIRLWVIQVVIIIAMTQFLGLFLSRIRQPRVIAEVIGGVILGPSVMGHIPGFTDTIFSTDSMPLLNLTANIGLVLFLFLVGLEIDVRVIKRNAKASTAISVVGLILPLGLGAAVAIPIYHEFINESVNFGYFILFVAVAMGITAFPVLCRILTELKLLDTTVGVVVLSAGVGNDVVGWILLALTVALVNASSGLTALWVLLAGAGYTIFLLFPVRWVFHWLAKRSGSLESGQPTRMMMTLTIMIVFISAFYTDIIGIHAIFGGFLTGLIIPHENGFAIALVEKLEDIVSILFLPLYFTLSGLSTNLGLLDNGVTWGYTILICVVAFFSKFIGCASMAKLTGFNYRESGAIGSLMSCKGLVELIVLNVGLSAEILDTRTFSMFVLHAIVLTFMTTPLTLLFYPAKCRVNLNSSQDKAPVLVPNSEDGNGRANVSAETLRTRFSVVLDKMEQLPAVMTIMQLLQYPVAHMAAPASSNTSLIFDEKTPRDTIPPSHPSHPSHVHIDALRLIELTERTSAVLKSQEADLLINSDPVLSVFRTFGHLNRVSVATSLSVVGYEDFTACVTGHARESSAQLIILPWSTILAPNNVLTENQADRSSTASPFDGIFWQKYPIQEQTSVVYSQFIRRVFAESPTDVALFMDRRTPSPNEHIGQHIYMPFFGGADDRLALSFVVQLCMNPHMTATVVRLNKTLSNELTPLDTIEEAKAQLRETVGSMRSTDTVYGLRDTQTRLASDIRDNLIWNQYCLSQAPEIKDALSRITFREQSSSRLLHASLEGAASAQAQSSRRLLVVVGRSRRMALESHSAELKEFCTTHGVNPSLEVTQTMGDAAAAFVFANTNGSLLVLQAHS